MSLKIGELFTVGFRGPSIPEWLSRFAQKFSLGGVILFDYDFQAKKYENNIESPEQLTALTKSLAQLPSRPLIMVDQEGGKVRRLKDSKGFQPLPSAKEFAILPRSQKVHVLEAAFKEMRRLGIDLNLAPVVDLDLNPKNPDIGAIGRSFSASAASVRENVQIMAEIARRAGVMLCLKHYPGLGGATTNSHEELTDLGKEIPDDQLQLFYELVPRIPGEAVLVSHGIYQEWDKELPVSMCPRALRDLRTQLPTALFISDDLQMQGLQVKMSTADAVFCGLAAGLDQVIIGNNLLNEESSMEDAALHIVDEAEKDPAFKRRLELSIAKVQLRKSKVPKAAKVTG